ncbi:MAG: hypothetical protein KDI56_16995 [Xanthomonadales bacterium]|nr:hypothetical protein [Xanthomonadales bacterium]
MGMRIVVALVGMLVGAVASAEIVVERFEGSSMKTPLSNTIAVNDKSTLNQQWVVINDSAMPLQIMGKTGVSAVYESGRSAYSGDYRFTAATDLQGSEPIVAYQLRFLVFDVFGNSMQTLSLTEVEDRDGGVAFRGTAKWRATENQVEELYASVAFVSAVRTNAGKVYTANYEAVLAEARKVGSKITMAEIEPERPKE